MLNSTQLKIEVKVELCNIWPCNVTLFKPAEVVQSQTVRPLQSHSCWVHNWARQSRTHRGTHIISARNFSPQTRIINSRNHIATDREGPRGFLLWSSDTDPARRYQPQQQQQRSVQQTGFLTSIDPILPQLLRLDSVKNIGCKQRSSFEVNGSKN